MKGFKNVNAYVEGKGIVKTDISFDNGLITAIGENVVNDDVITLPDNAVVLPGFIDQHIHGADGSDGMDGTVENLSKIANAVVKEGTTCFLATTMTQSPENIIKALTAVNDYVNLNKTEGAEILGAHLEGPFISSKHVGAQPPQYVVNPSVETFEKYVKASGNHIKIVSFAPEVEGAEELAKYCVKNGIVASIGHTSAKYAEANASVEFGMSNVTHTFNAQTGLHHRDVGVVGTALLNDKLNCEIICDTIHLSVPAIKLVIKNKPHDKVTLITDSMRAKHLPDGESELGGQLVIVKNGEARLVDGTLAGSVLKMNDAIKNVVEKVGVPFTDAIDFATVNPAKNLGVYNERGSIAVGKKADFAVMDKNTYEILLTVRNGVVVYQK
ncbi:MAG: N-acetylglucosamine-6-phosphate deacetylase [Clostridia bacterium]|nr:N-acetylglucosamine-6-phosphate deacetylase [Clostridia bacterium]